MSKSRVLVTQHLHHADSRSEPLRLSECLGNLVPSPVQPTGNITLSLHAEFREAKGAERGTLNEGCTALM